MTDPTTTTLTGLLAAGADDAVALAAPERVPLDFAGLKTQIADTVGWLAGIGIGRTDRVAIVLPNGPEMASSFLAVAAAATTAPLNPAYRADEFAFYLDDLAAKALIVPAGSDSAAVAVAEARGLPVVTLEVADGAPAGRFALAGGRPGTPAADGAVGPDDIALILHTSGTTSRPKMVPLSHANLAASARHIIDVLALTAADRCLNIMPLFHIHGLVAALVSSLAAGGSVYCTPGFNALRFFAWLDDAAPSWYTGVPTMHQAILGRAGRNAEVIARRPLRFIRSSSASLPPPVMAALEATFGCPVIESYGMTEAAHQMASNPLPPRPRKPGTVGPAAGPEIAVLGEGGGLLPPGQPGEVVIRGPNVTRGYQANPKANAEGFVDGWFRTGDQGVIDTEGYLRITGRIKEIINRGGEKISPREVDETLIDHPAVAQAVTFALPHAKLGEEPAAVVVLGEDQTATEAELKEFVAVRLADFKVPRRILFVDEIPKGPTGKLQRIGLAKQLGLVE